MLGKQVPTYPVVLQGSLGGRTEEVGERCSAHSMSFKSWARATRREPSLVLNDQVRIKGRPV